MIKSYQYLDIDINKKTYRRLRAVQGDSKSRYILVSLYDNSKAYNLSNCSVKVFGCKSDKKIFFNYAIVTDVINGKFEIELTNQALAAAGELEIQILILGTNQERLTSFSFYIDVEKSIVNDGAIESANEFKALTGALSQVNEWNGYFEETSGKIEEKYTERLNNVNSQLEHKANNSEVRKKVDDIMLKDLSTEVKQAMTGGSVAVVGLDSVGKENLKNNSVEATKVNESLVIRGIPCINYLKDTLKSPSNNFYKETLAKIVEVEDRTLSHLDITKVTKHTILQGTTNEYGTMIYGRLMHGINGVNIHDLANKNVRISFFAKSNRDFNLTLSLKFAGKIIKEVDLPIINDYNYFSIEGLLESENYNESNTDFSCIFYEKSSNMISDTDVFIAGVQILVDNNDKTCISVNVKDNYYSEVDIDLLKSGLNGAYPRINELKNSLTNPLSNWYNAEKYFKITQIVNNDFSHMGVKSITHHENNEIAISNYGVIYLGRIQAIDLNKGMNKKIKFKTFIRANSNLQVHIAFSANVNDSKKIFNLSTDWNAIELEFDFSSYDIDETDLYIYTSGISQLPAGTWIELAGNQILVSGNTYSDFIFTLNQYDDYYNYYPKSDKKILVPPKVYSVANDLDSSRNQTVAIYVDHLLDTCFDENIVFEDTNKDYTVIEPYFEQHDKYTNAINKGMDKYTEIITKKINSTVYNIPDFKTQHISTKSSVGRTKHPKVLFIGDSITAGVGVRNFGLGIADQAYPYWIHCKNLFDMDKIDGGNKENEFNFTCLGYGGGELYDDVYREATINYKGVKTSSRQSTSGMSSWSLEKVMTDPTSPFYDDSAEGTYKFSIKKFIDKYRTMDDEGNRLTLESPSKGSLVTTQDFLNKINVCNPTHIILQHGRNSEGTIDEFLLALDEFIRIAKTEFPNAKIGVCIPPDRAGTFFPKKYPNVKSTSTQSVDLNSNYKTGRKAYDIAKAIIEKYNSNSDIELIPNFFVAPTAMGFPFRESVNYGGENIYYPYFAGGLDSHPGFFAHLNWGYQVYAWIKSTLV